MRLYDDQLKMFEEQGLLFLQEYFSRAEVGVLREQLPSVYSEDSPRRILEKEGGAVRSVYGPHTTNEVFRLLSRHPRIVEPVVQILGSGVYLYQLKINVKAAFEGDVWAWHQDYIFWRNEDGMPSPRAVNAMIFLDDVTEFNGAIFFIPGSHKEGMIDVRASGKTQAKKNSTLTPYVSTKLKYSLNREVVAGLVSRYGMVAPKGPAGSVLFFHSNIVHGSSNNISPFDRTIVILTFNSVENIPKPVKPLRPDFLAGRDHKPIVPVSADALERKLAAIYEPE